jgi:hypothetical protein
LVWQFCDVHDGIIPQNRFPCNPHSSVTPGQTSRLNCHPVAKRGWDELRIPDDDQMRPPLKTSGVLTFTSPPIRVSFCRFDYA